MNAYVLIKSSQKTSVLTLIIISSLIKSYVLGVYKNRLGEAILIHIHKV